MEEVEFAGEGTVEASELELGVDVAAEKTVMKLLPLGEVEKPCPRDDPWILVSKDRPLL